SGVGRGQSRRHAAPLSGRYAWHRSLAPVARRILERNTERLQGSRRAGGQQRKEFMMTEQSMSSGSHLNSVRKVVSVEAPQNVAWQVFTEQMGAWWPLATYKIGKASAVDAVIEPRVGGRWYERGEDGSTCDWGRVLAWDPHSRLVLSWDITADWQYDPALQTEIELHFIAEGSSRRRLEFDIGGLDGWGERGDERRRLFDKTGAWGRLLAASPQTAATSVRAWEAPLFPPAPGCFFRKGPAMPHYTAVVTL